MNDPKCKPKVKVQCTEIVETLKPVIDAYNKIEQIKQQIEASKINKD